jgi:hypothetical protein
MLYPCYIRLMAQVPAARLADRGVQIWVICVASTSVSGRLSRRSVLPAPAGGAGRASESLLDLGDA